MNSTHLQSDNTAKGLLFQWFVSWQDERPGRSLRGFARKLDVSAPHLANLLAGRRNLTSQTAEKIAKQLNLSEKETAEFRSKIKLNGFSKGDLDPESLSEERFRYIADWHHLGLMSLAKIDGYKYTPEDAAKRLGVSVAKVSEAASRLKNLELLDITPEGIMERHAPRTVTGNRDSSAAIRRHHQQSIEKSLFALDHIDARFRQYETSTMCIDANLLPELKKEVSKFHDRLEALASKSTRKTDVYILGSQFFPAAEAHVDENDSHEVVH